MTRLWQNRVLLIPGFVVIDKTVILILETVGLLDKTVILAKLCLFPDFMTKTVFISGSYD